jgi:uncharacterized phiE125 gp8 family phage protein
MTTHRNRLLARVVAPANEPLTLSETKLYLRVDDTSSDSLINDLITASRMMAEHWLKRSLITQTWKLVYDDYVPDQVTLPMGPVGSISSVVTIGRDNSTQTMDSDLYYLNASKNTIIFDSMVVGFKVEITYTAGYGNAAAVPKPIKQGMLAHIADMYDNRGMGCNSALPELSTMLYMPFREICL